MKTIPNVRVEAAPTATISWGNLVGIIIVAMFVLYLIAKGRLGVYIGLLFGSAAMGGSGAAGAPQEQASGSLTAGNPFLAGQTIPVSSITSNPLGQSLLTSQAPLLFGQ